MRVVGIMAAAATAWSLGAADAAAQSTSSTLTPFGLSLCVGGGVSGFADRDVERFVEPGGAWAARLTVGTKLPLAFEAAYTGSANRIDAPGLAPDAVLLGTGAEAAARINLVPWIVSPYLAIGLGWRRYTLAQRGPNLSSVRGSDQVVEVPVAAGLSWYLRGPVLELRAAYRAAVEEDLMDRATPNEALMDTWTVSGNLGWEF